MLEHLCAYSTVVGLLRPCHCRHPRIGMLLLKALRVVYVLLHSCPLPCSTQCGSYHHASGVRFRFLGLWHRQQCAPMRRGC